MFAPSELMKVAYSLGWQRFPSTEYAETQFITNINDKRRFMGM